ncbi:hypothetical protein CHE218_01580 [Microbacterium sp. che218]
MKIAKVSPSDKIAVALSREDPGTASIYHAMSADHLPLRKLRPWVCSIQDVIPLDLKAYTRFGIRTRINFANARRADVVLTNCNYTADRIMKRLFVPAKKIVVAPLPVSALFRQERLQEDDSPNADIRPYILAMVDLRTPDPRKRYHWIGQISAALTARGHRFVVAGRGLDRMVFPGADLVEAPSDAQLRSLFVNAAAFYYPSAYEGQGLPPIEAMASGCPTLAYRNSSVQEVVQGGGAVLDDPAPWQRQRLGSVLDQADVDEAVSTLVSWVHGGGPASESVRQSARRFSQENFREGLLEAYSLAAR